MERLLIKRIILSFFIVYQNAALAEQCFNAIIISKIGAINHIPEVIISIPSNTFNTSDVLDDHKTCQIQITFSDILGNKIYVGEFIQDYVKYNNQYNTIFRKEIHIISGKYKVDINIITGKLDCKMNLEFITKARHRNHNNQLSDLVIEEINNSKPHYNTLVTNYRINTNIQQINILFQAFTSSLKTSTFKVIIFKKNFDVHNLFSSSFISIRQITKVIKLDSGINNINILLPIENENPGEYMIELYWLEEDKIIEESNTVIFLPWKRLHDFLDVMSTGVDKLAYVTDTNNSIIKGATFALNDTNIISAFWKYRAMLENNPWEITMENYYKYLLEADSLFSISNIKGWKTPRGKIYILYRTPTLVSSVKFDSYVVEKWKFNKLSLIFRFKDSQLITINKYDI